MMIDELEMMMLVTVVTTMWMWTSYLMMAGEDDQLTDPGTDHEMSRIWMMLQH